MPRNSHANSNNAGPSSSPEINAIGSFLRSLATRAEANAALAAELHSALQESGLLEQFVPARQEVLNKAKKAGTKNPAMPAPTGTPAMRADPFRVLHEQGENGLRQTLESLDLGELHSIVRTHRLDPGRISARWTRRERLIELIVSQVVAHTSHGKAFSRV